MPNREMKVQIARRTSSREFSISFWLRSANRVVCEFLVITLTFWNLVYVIIRFDVFWVLCWDEYLDGTKRQAVLFLCTVEGGWWRGSVNSLTKPHTPKLVVFLGKIFLLNNNARKLRELHSLKKRRNYRMCCVIFFFSFFGIVLATVLSFWETILRNNFLYFFFEMLFWVIKESIVW